MTREEIVARVNEAFAREFELDSAQLVENANLHDDLGLDSLDRVDMVIVLEKAFSFTVSDKSQLAKIATLGDIYDYIEANAANDH
ncbi:MAG: acyl carrier protein [Desulfovibrionaceae bacterium]|nr:acyl carrier protein [Desulfovibrionaceae bacterium]